MRTRELGVMAIVLGVGCGPKVGEPFEPTTSTGPSTGPSADGARDAGWSSPTSPDAGAPSIASPDASVDALDAAADAGRPRHGHAMIVDPESRCASDADCTVTTWPGCCDGCPTQPSPISIARLRAQKAQCASVRCKPMNIDCLGAASTVGLTAVCNQDKVCALPLR